MSFTNGKMERSTASAPASNGVPAPTKPGAEKSHSNRRGDTRSNTDADKPNEESTGSKSASYGRLVCKLSKDVSPKLINTADGKSPPKQRLDSISMGKKFSPTASSVASQAKGRQSENQKEVTEATLHDSLLQALVSEFYTATAEPEKKNTAVDLPVTHVRSTTAGARTAVPADGNMRSSTANSTDKASSRADWDKTSNANEAVNSLAAIKVKSHIKILLDSFHHLTVRAQSFHKLVDALSSTTSKIYIRR